MPDPSEYTVDLVAGTVKHKSGAIAIFDLGTPTSSGQLQLPSQVRNSDLFPHFSGDFAVEARAAAMAAGMRSWEQNHSNPE